MSVPIPFGKASDLNFWDARIAVHSGASDAGKYSAEGLSFPWNTNCVDRRQSQEVAWQEGTSLPGFRSKSGNALLAISSRMRSPLAKRHEVGSREKSQR